MRKLIWADTAVGMLHSEIGPVLVSMLLNGNVHQDLRRNLTRVGLASDQLLPSLSTLTNNVGGIPPSVSIVFSLGGGMHTSCSCTLQ
jgi:hypothetical protein